MVLCAIIADAHSPFTQAHGTYRDNRYKRSQLAFEQQHDGVINSHVLKRQTGESIETAFKKKAAIGLAVTRLQRKLHDFSEVKKKRSEVLTIK